VWTDGRRWMPSDVLFEETGHYKVVFSRDDEAPMGLRIETATAIDWADLPPADPYGTHALPCLVPVSGPLTFNWLSQGACLREQWVGVELVIEVSL
jgi:hypothetical protein